MKVLMITPYVTINSRSEFARNKTGFGYMVMDIAKAVGEQDKVFVLATDSRGRAFEYEGTRFLERSLLKYLCSIIYGLPFFSLIKLRKDYKMRKDTFIRLVYYGLATGYLKRIINKEKYDIVHIHGCGFATELWMQVCNKCGQKYVVTLHGFNSFSDTVNIELAGKKYERDFLKRVTNGDIPITVISTGMKKLLEKTYNTGDLKNIYVVCNSFSFYQENVNTHIRPLYHIPCNASVLLYVGNISWNKNQAQMVRVFSQLPETMRKRTYVLFCGKDTIGNGEMKRLISSCPDGNHLFLCGDVDKSMIQTYYRDADGVVLLSFTEGFGLSLVEGMHFGLPCVMPNDLDAFEDIYNECAVVPIYGREDNEVRKAIEKLLDTKWDIETIKEYSSKFDSRTMANKYREVYKAIIK